MKNVLIAAAGLVALAAPALAADMAPAPRTYTKAPPVVAAVYNWTGFYIGIEGGGGWANTRHTNAGNGANSGTVKIDGGLVGGTYGYNWQMGSWVIGFEGDFSWSGIEKTFNDTGSGFCSSPLMCFTNLRWLGTDRARLGYAWDRLLVYGTAGVAYGNVQGTLKNAPAFALGDNTRTGFVFGGGAEWAFAPSWSVKAEYLRIDNLGDKVTYPFLPGPPGFPEKVSLSNINIVRAGLNFRFGGPIVANY